MYKKTIDVIKTLKVVEYVGPKTKSVQLVLSDMRIKVQVYEMYHDARTLDENMDLPQAEITSLPHLRFEGKWDEWVKKFRSPMLPLTDSRSSRLVFENDLKTELIWMMYNICKPCLGTRSCWTERGLMRSVRFSAKNDLESNINPLVLLHGPPGTGKTTLSQALAQKVSIRLADTYKDTKLLEIKTATLLSKFFSQSAKQVEEIFRKICQMCEDEGLFVCVLIDEVESVATSRERANTQGEAQDSLRATNALLTGIDRLKGYPNVLLLCTSNFVDCLDEAFLDRCALKQAIGNPSKKSQYAILRGRIQSLIDQGIIRSDTLLPTFSEAELDYAGRNADGYGYKLLKVLDGIRAFHVKADSGLKISGRSLAQLPQTAILRFMREEECNLDTAFGFFEKYVLLEQPHKGESTEEDDPDELKDEPCPVLEIRGKKRKLTVLLEDECDANVLREFMEHLKRPEHPMEENQDDEQSE